MSDLSSHHLAAIERFADLSVLCLGDFMLAQIVEGSVERISPEAPIPVLDIAGERSMLGGAGNVVANLAALGCRCYALGVIGEDGPGRDIQVLLDQLAGVTSHLIADGDRPTTQKLRLVASGQQLLRADRERRHRLSSAREESLIETARGLMETVDVVALSDYAKGVLTERVTGTVIDLARAENKPVVVDPKGLEFTRYEGAHLVKPNRGELERVAGRALPSIEEVVDAAKRLRSTIEVDNLLITLGGKGMVLIDSDGADQRIEAIPQEVFDVVGAGDTVLAVASAGLGAGLDALQTSQLANIAGSLVVGRRGTVALDAATLAEAVAGTGPKLFRRGAWSLDRLVAEVERLRDRGQRIGFTNGCFDLLHVGHLALVDQARDVCDFLVVGLNSDSSVKRLKGEERPINDQHRRARLLSGLEAVDAVVLFDEDTPETLIRKIRPDLLVKGADYRMEDVVGADFVRQQGGEVLLVELVADASTTSLITKFSS
ncbi:MAG: D-glycero-beta-D-manno-heptose 1-phosphate adenylyltransferase [Geminicoccaceae bacterium]